MIGRFMIISFKLVWVIKRYIKIDKLKKENIGMFMVLKMEEVKECRW